MLACDLERWMYRERRLRSWRCAQDEGEEEQRRRSAEMISWREAPETSPGSTGTGRRCHRDATVYHRHMNGGVRGTGRTETVRTRRVRYGHGTVTPRGQRPRPMAGKLQVVSTGSSRPLSSVSAETRVSGRTSWEMDAGAGPDPHDKPPHDVTVQSGAATLLSLELWPWRSSARLLRPSTRRWRPPLS